MKLFHLIFGLATVLVFLATGQYMDRHFHHLVGMPDGIRMLYRTRHIYILLAGLLNLSLGTYFIGLQEVGRKVLQWLGSGLIIVATVLFIGAFFYEPGLANLCTPLSHWGMYTILAGTLIHVISGIQSSAFRLPVPRGGQPEG